MIEVFKTNVLSREDANQVLEDYSAFFPNWKIGFDLEDCDHILRVDSGDEKINVAQIQHILNKFGFKAELLEN